MGSNTWRRRIQLVTVVGVFLATLVTKSVFSGVVPRKYIPSELESTVFTRAKRLRFDASEGTYAKGCSIWIDPPKDIVSFSTKLWAYAEGTRNYKDWRESFHRIDDVRLLKATNGTRICDTLFQGSDISDFFPGSSLSFLETAGFVEPLLPPLRAPEICLNHSAALLSLDYLVHDHESACKAISMNSRTAFFDIGAALDFHADYQPVIELMGRFRKFGIYFDHVYAYESTVYSNEALVRMIPEEMRGSYRWLGKASVENPAKNPLNIIKRLYLPSDFVVLKLDIDHPELELAFIRQILEDKDLSSRIDHLYFEHHVHLEELSVEWADDVEGSVLDSLLLFGELRRAGIAAHYWI